MKRYHLLLLLVVAVAMGVSSIRALQQGNYVEAVLWAFLGISYIPLQRYNARRGSPPDSVTLFLPVSAAVVILLIALLRLAIY